MRGPTSIRGAFLLLGGIASGVAVLLAVVLAISVAWMALLARDFTFSVEGLRAAKRIQVELLLAARAHQLLGETGDPRWKDDLARAEADLAVSLEHSKHAADSAEEAALVRDLAVHVEQIRRQVLAAPPDGHTITRGEIGAALASADRLVDHNEAVANGAIARAELWSRIAKRVAIVLLFLALAGVAAASVYARRALFQPVYRFREQLETRPLDSDEPLPEEGPLEVRRIAATVNRLGERLAAQRAQRIAFLSAVAHDLRVPMTGLRVAAQLGARQTDPEKARERWEVVLRQVERMNRMVEDLLDFGRIEAGRFELHREKRDLREAVREAAAFFAGASELHEIRLQLPDLPVPVDYDPVRISQVLNNLLSNAQKYSPEGGPIDVRIVTRDDRAVVEVVDRGLGIPSDELETVFEPFRRSGGLRGDIPGVGLGLSVSRRLARAHGGDLEVESEVGRGSTFRVVLPLAS